MAKAHRQISALDIGTTEVRLVVGEITDNDELEIVGIGKAPSRGVRKGVVVNIEATVDSSARDRHIVGKGNDFSRQFPAQPIQQVLICIQQLDRGLVSGLGEWKAGNHNPGWIDATVNVNQVQEALDTNCSGHQ